jgi:hypothetical protein
MTSVNDHISLEDLASLHELQKKVCDLATIKCAGYLGVHLQARQGAYRNALVISNRDNGRILYLYLTAQGWLFAAHNASGLSWELPLIGSIADDIGIIQDRIEAFLLPLSQHEEVEVENHESQETLRPSRRFAVV